MADEIFGLNKDWMTQTHGLSPIKQAEGLKELSPGQRPGSEKVPFQEAGCKSAIDLAQIPLTG